MNLLLIFIIVSSSAQEFNLPPPEQDFGQDILDGLKEHNFSIEDLEDVEILWDNRNEDETFGLNLFNLSRLVQLENEDLTKYVDPKVEIEEKLQLRSCGFKERCAKKGLTQDSSLKFHENFNRSSIDFQRDPFTCHCDDECYKFGDCCISVLLDLLDEINENDDILWACFPLQLEAHQYDEFGDPEVENFNWAMMITECTHSSSDDICEKFCNAAIRVPTSIYHYELDIPVYSKKTEHLYFNRYCALCNGLQMVDIEVMEPTILCNKNFTSEGEIEKFLQNARYEPGKRYWYTRDKTFCGIYFENLSGRSVKKIIPNLRPCTSGAIEDCPNNDHIAKICGSYSQFVEVRGEPELYKNPHCALCNGINIANDVRCYRYGNSLQDLSNLIPVISHNRRYVELQYDFTEEMSSTLLKETVIPSDCQKENEMVDEIIYEDNSNESTESGNTFAFLLNNSTNTTGSSKNQGILKHTCSTFLFLVATFVCMFKVFYVLID